jgi:hypothetical protein
MSATEAGRRQIWRASVVPPMVGDASRSHRGGAGED